MRGRREGYRSQEVAERRALVCIAVSLLGGALALRLVPSGGDPLAALAAERVAARRGAHDAVHAEPAGVAAERVETPVGRDPAFLERAPAPEAVCDDPATERWVEDLRDDGVPFNATRAIEQLVDLPPGRVPALERALDSADAQQRHMAAGVWRVRCEMGTARPSRRLLEVLVDALDSRLDVDVHGTCVWPLTAESARFLVDHVEAAREPLERGLQSGDGQQRLLCAYLLARGGVTRQPTRAAYVLVQHLADNSIPGDAVMAANGLYMLGEHALPVLGDSMRGTDAQTHQLVQLIVRDLEAPPKDRRELVQRARLHAVTDLYHDPVIEYDVHRSRVPQFRMR